MKVEVNNNKEEIDWNKPQLLISNQGCIVQTTGECNHHSFGAICLDVGGTFNTLFGFSTLWSKVDFKPFKGTVTLQNG